MPGHFRLGIMPITNGDSYMKTELDLHQRQSNINGHVIKVVEYLTVNQKEMNYEIRKHRNIMLGLLGVQAVFAILMILEVVK